MDFSTLYSNTKNSVVKVGVIINGNLDSWGTGVVIDDGNHVLTCNHCVNASAINVVVQSNNVQTTNGGLNIINGRIIFADSLNDVALLEFPSAVGTPAKFVDSGTLKIGNEIFTIGYPYDFLCEPTLTCGNVSAFENGLIKIDNSVNGGNSGGPLFNSNGEVVGIINAKLGGLSTFLTSVKNRKQCASIVVGGVDPVQTIQLLIKEMERNLNLGIGFAVPTSTIKTLSPFFSKNII